MLRVTKWVTTVGAVLGTALVFVPAFYSVSHTQTLTNVLFGQFGAIAIGHTAYRVSYGKLPSLRASVIGLVCGAVIAVSPIVLGLVSGFTTFNMVGGGIVTVGGVLGIVAAVVADEDRDVPDLATERESAETEETAELA